MEELKGFIEVTEKGLYGNTMLVHYTQVYFITPSIGVKVAIHNGTTLRESYEEIKQLIKNAQ